MSRPAFDPITLEQILTGEGFINTTFADQLQGNCRAIRRYPFLLHQPELSATPGGSYFRMFGVALNWPAAPTYDGRVEQVVCQLEVQSTGGESEWQLTDQAAAITGASVVKSAGSWEWIELALTMTGLSGVRQVELQGRLNSGSGAIEARSIRNLAWAVES